MKKYPEDSDLLEDVIVENKQAIEMTNIYSGILSGMMDAFASVISNNLNIVMKVLAIVTVIMLTAKGYGGEMKLICGMDADGKITGCETLSQQETQGLGSKTTLPKFRDQFQGKDASLEGVDTISGATISSTAYIKAIKDAFTAYDLAKGAAQ